MLIYIIGQITGNQEYREQFARAEEALRAVYACDIINPARGLRWWKITLN